MNLGRGWFFGLLLVGVATAGAAQEPPQSPLVLPAPPEAAGRDGGLSLLPVAPPISETDYRAQNAPSRAATPIPARPVSRRPIDQPFDGERVRGALAVPEGTSPTAAVLLTPGVMGVNEDMRLQAEKLASLGVAAFAVDLYGGRDPADRREAFQMYRRLDRATKLKRLDAARRWLAGQGGARPLAVAIAGFGLGAEDALASAALDPAPAGLVLFCGGATTDENQLRALRCPVLGFFARRDGNLTPARVDAFESALKNAGIKHQVFRYDTAPGFEEKSRPARDQSYADTARRRIVELLAGP